MEIIEKLGLNKSDFIVLSTSSLSPVKDIDLAITSFNSFLTNFRINDAYLLLVGDGKLKNQLIELAKSYSIENNIKFLGAIDGEQIPHYLSIADVLVATSLYSNLNLSVQEAMASGKPVIAFDSGGTSKLIKHMENGILVKPRNIEGFSDKLYLLYENLELRENIGNNARETIMKERNWENIVKKVVKIYERV
ncbi:unnamed protein product [marine sediment metagenome]|uniref:Glycosyl transferase family 1 domain-containing protein n=1 Tax=marine sediment metagenome TaxID=412755 RepID=X1G2E7_9ZZZZ